MSKQDVVQWFERPDQVPRSTGALIKDSAIGHRLLL